MIPILVTSNTPGAGKTLAALATVLALKDRGLTAGYFKPVCRDPRADADLAFAREMAASTKGVTVLDPLPLKLSALGNATPALLLEQVKSALNSAAPRFQALVMEAPSLNDPLGDFTDFCVHLAKGSGARVLALLGYRPDMDWGPTLRKIAGFGDSLLGSVVNKTTAHRVHRMEEVLREEAAQAARPMGVIPEDRLILSISLEQVADGLEGEWLWGREHGGRLVERYLIGGNLMDSGDTYFGRGDGAKAVIVRGDRPDIQLAALNSDLRGLILTGGHRPVEYVSHEVKQRGVPLIVAPQSTDRTVKSLEKALDGARPYHPAKVDRFRALLEDRCGLNAAIESLLN